ncbi:MAG: DUF1049 domain-containing protein [Nitrospinae bacterium]|nr:DUF1049 domain-containing protein [Nitrospinota bacterium]
MRAAAATIFVFLLVTVGFIILNLQPATISIFGLVQMTQPLGVVVSIAFFGGALIAYLLIEGAGILRSWRERNRRKVSKASSDADEEYHIGLEAIARGEPAAAREALERALDDDQDHVGALFVLGNLDREAGDSEGAIQRHITANARRPGTPAILWALAEDYAQAAELDPKDHEYSEQQGYALHLVGKFQEALAPLDRAVELHDTCFNAHHYRALVKAALDDHRGAVDDLTKAVELYAENYDEGLAAYHYERAKAYLELGELERAKSDCEEAIRLENLAVLAQAVFLKSPRVQILTPELKTKIAAYIRKEIE